MVCSLLSLFALLLVVPDSALAGPLRPADPPLLGRPWYESGGSFTISAMVPASKQHIKSPSGIETDVANTYILMVSGGGSVTPWLEIGGQAYEGATQTKLKNDPTFESYNTFVIFAGPWARPYVRARNLRLWAGGGYLGGIVIANAASLDPLGAGSGESTRFTHGAVYGGGIDWALGLKPNKLGKKRAFVFSVSYEAGAPPLMERFEKTEKESNVGPAFAPARFVVGMGGGF